MRRTSHYNSLASQTGSSLARYRELILFLVVGCTSALIYMNLGVFFTVVGGMRPSMAIVATLLLLIPPTYLAQRSLAFRSSRRHASAFPRYIATQAFGNILALAGSEIFGASIQSQPWLGFLAVAIAVAACNFVLLKFWTFRSAN